MTQLELASHPLTTELAQCGNLFHRWQWSLATSSNYSALLENEKMIISRSGVDKEKMVAADFMLTDFSGRPLAGYEDLRSSAETELHCHIYRSNPEARAVLHTHSKFAVYFSRKFLAAKEMRITGFEMQKIFEGVSTHDSRISIPVFANSQNMKDIVKDFDEYLSSHSWPPAYLIAGHGIYTWGASVARAKQKLEGIEHLFELIYMEERNAK